MAGSTIGTLLEMIKAIISGALGTLQSLFGLFGDLGGNLDIVSRLGGPVGMIMAVVILAIVVFLFGKFVLGTGKIVIFLAAVGLLILLLVLSLG